MKGNILILTDEMYSTDYWIEYFIKDKFKDRFAVIRTEKPDEILEKLSAGNIDLVIVNSRQPAGHWPGTGCTEIVKKIRLLYNVPLIIISEFKDWDREQEYREAGATDVIPLDYEKFKELPNRVIEILKNKINNREEKL